MRTPRVLVVDDCTLTRRSTAAILGHFGFQVTTAGDGKEAIDIARIATAENYGFDLVLMDIDMPVMDGMEAAHELRFSGFKNPIIAITGSIRSDLTIACKAAGFDQVIFKPMQPGQLSEIIQQYLPGGPGHGHRCAA